MTKPKETAPGDEADLVEHCAKQRHQPTESGRAGASEQTGWEDLPLAPQHVAMLVASGITPKQAGLRGYETVLDGQRLGDEFGFPEHVGQYRAPGLLIPRHDVNHQVWGYLFRPDRIDFPRWQWQTAAKYETRPGDPHALDIPPGVDAAMLGDPDTPLWLTDGVKKADCGAAHGLCIVDVSGMWKWELSRRRHCEFESPDWNEILFNRRKAIVCYDNNQLHNWMHDLGSFLEKMGARVSCAWLSDTGTNTGLDDYLRDHTVGQLHRLILPFRQKPGDPGERPPDDDPDGLIAAADELLRREDLVAAVGEIRELVDRVSDKFGDEFDLSPYTYRELVLIETLQAQILPPTGDRDAFAEPMANDGALSRDRQRQQQTHENDNSDGNPHDSGENTGAAQKPGPGAASEATREGTSLSRKLTELQHLKMRTFSLMKRLTERAMVELTQDLVSGRIDTIPSGGADWIEDILIGRLSVRETTDLVFAYWWAQHGWEVFPQRGDGLSAISHPKGSPQRWVRRCGQYGDGHPDATTNLARIRGWGRQYGLHWGGVGARVPQGVLALYIDPCRGGDENLAALEAEYGPLPPTQEIIAEKINYDPDGRHRCLFFRMPAAMELTERGLKGTGIALKTEGAAVRIPPSNHTYTTRHCLLVPRPVAPAPDWLLSLLGPRPGSHRKASARRTGKQSIVDGSGPG